MNRGVLLDTHTLFWLDTEPERLTPKALTRILDRSTPVFVSAITAWELGIKVSLGKLLTATPLLMHYHETLARYGFTELPFTSTHALLASRLSWEHKDPFDRALVAQAKSEQLTLVSADAAMRSFAEVVVLW